MATSVYDLSKWGPRILAPLSFANYKDFTTTSFACPEVEAMVRLLLLSVGTSILLQIGCAFGPNTRYMVSYSSAKSTHVKGQLNNKEHFVEKHTGHRRRSVRSIHTRKKKMEDSSSKSLFSSPILPMRVKPAIKGSELDDLEQALSWKYGSSKTNPEIIDDDDFDDDEYFSAKPLPKTRGPNAVQKFAGFQASTTNLSSGKEVDNETGLEDDKGLEKKDKSISVKRTSTSALLEKLLSGKKLGRVDKTSDVVDETIMDNGDRFEYEGASSDSIRRSTQVSTTVAQDGSFGVYNDKILMENSIDSTRDLMRSNYRLRKPKEVPKEVQAAAEKAAMLKEANLKARDEARKARRKLKRSLDENQYYKFELEISKSERTHAYELFSQKTFQDIGINDERVLKNLESLNIFNPTKIQELAIPLLQKGQNLLMQAQTGSGKTLGFLLPLLDVVDKDSKKVQAIILAPSRELVAQIATVGDKIFKNTDYRIMSIIGGANIRGQIQRLRDQRPQIIVATPGRLAEIVFGLEKLQLGTVLAVVIDEVDNLLREPYHGEMQTILAATSVFRRKNVAAVGNELVTNNEYSDKREDEDVFESSFHSPSKVKQKGGMVCFSSATGSTDIVTDFVDDLYDSRDMCKKPWQKIAIDCNNAALPVTISHALISCPRIKALDTLKKLIKSNPEVKAAIIFVNDPYRVEIVCNKLLEMGIVAAPLHGETAKDDRKDILTRLRDGRLPLVVATELAARGIDIPNLTHVINFELPTDSQHYVHRAGRCGRAGRNGLVVNFATPDTKFVIRRFGKQLGVKIRDCQLRNGHVWLKSK